MRIHSRLIPHKVSKGYCQSNAIILRGATGSKHRTPMIFPWEAAAAPLPRRLPPAKFLLFLLLLRRRLVLLMQICPFASYPSPHAGKIQPDQPSLRDSSGLQQRWANESGTSLSRALFGFISLMERLCPEFSKPVSSSVCRF